MTDQLLWSTAEAFLSGFNAACFMWCIGQSRRLLGLANLCAAILILSFAISHVKGLLP